MSTGLLAAIYSVHACPRFLSLRLHPCMAIYTCKQPAAIGARIIEVPSPILLVFSSLFSDRNNRTTCRLKEENKGGNVATNGGEYCKRNTACCMLLFSPTRCSCLRKHLGCQILRGRLVFSLGGVHLREGGRETATHLQSQFAWIFPCSRIRLPAYQEVPSVNIFSKGYPQLQASHEFSRC